MSATSLPSNASKRLFGGTILEKTLRSRMILPSRNSLQRRCFTSERTRRYRSSASVFSTIVDDPGIETSIDRTDPSWKSGLMTSQNSLRSNDIYLPMPLRDAPVPRLPPHLTSPAKGEGLSGKARLLPHHKLAFARAGHSLSYASPPTRFSLQAARILPGVGMAFGSACFSGFQRSARTIARAHWK